MQLGKYRMRRSAGEKRAREEEGLHLGWVRISHHSGSTFDGIQLYKKYIFTLNSDDVPFGNGETRSQERVSQRSGSYVTGWWSGVPIFSFRREEDQYQGHAHVTARHVLGNRHRKPMVACMMTVFENLKGERQPQVITCRWVVKMPVGVWKMWKKCLLQEIEADRSTGRQGTKGRLYSQGEKKSWFQYNRLPSIGGLGCFNRQSRRGKHGHWRLRCPHCSGVCHAECLVWRREA